MRNQRKINNLYVFYRISDGSHKRQKCASKIESLNNAVKVFKDANFIIFSDGISGEVADEVKRVSKSNKNVTFRQIQAKGNSVSFRHIYEEAMKLQDNDFVYFLEEDYLHLSDSYNLLKEFAERNYTDYVTLYDHPDKYEEYEISCATNPYCRELGEKTVLFRTPNHHWKITNSTTMTFGAFVDTLKRDKSVFWKYTQDNIPLDFPLFSELGKEGRQLSSPVPSLSTHCDSEALAPIINWEEVKYE